MTLAETTYAAVAEAPSPAAAPPTPSATTMQQGLRNAESSLWPRTRPTSLIPTPDSRSTAHLLAMPTPHEPLTVPRARRGCWGGSAKMGPMEWLLLAISVCLVLACGVFGAAEYSFVAVDRAAVERAANDGDRQAQGGRTAVRSPSHALPA